MRADIFIIGLFHVKAFFSTSEDGFKAFHYWHTSPTRPGQIEMMMICKDEIPKEFVEFLRDNNVELDLYYSYQPKQHVKVLGGLELVPKEYLSIPWLSSTFTIPINAAKPQHPDWFYMDSASALAVQIMDPQKGEHILDICCAPGMKLSLLGRMVGVDGSVTGVDISKHRLSTCRSIVKAHKVGRCRLFCEDGTRFSIGPVQVGCTVVDDERDSIKTPFYQSTAYRRFPCRQLEQLYDKVLVDAQCTHDGSIKHIQKADLATWSSLKDQFTESSLSELYKLQYRLLENGYKMCKPRGTILYSTCSFSEKQNEDIVRQLLHSHPDARLEPSSVPGLIDHPQPFLRIDPRLHECGFLFIAKIIKGA